MKNENYTPVKYVNLIHRVLGTIELDPFSSSKANTIVNAERFFDKESNAFNHSWECKTMYMNPPYSDGLFKPSIIKFFNEFVNIREAIVLTNYNTETLAGQLLLKNCDALCFPDHRINFLNEDLKESNNNRYPQIFFYFGVNENIFIDVFKEIGVCY